jgi:hypothetical protein
MTTRNSPALAPAPHNDDGRPITLPQPCEPLLAGFAGASSRQQQVPGPSRGQHGGEHDHDHDDRNEEMTEHSLGPPPLARPPYGDGGHQHQHPTPTMKPAAAEDRGSATRSRRTTVGEARWGTGWWGSQQRGPPQGQGDSHGENGERHGIDRARGIYRQRHTRGHPTQRRCEQWTGGATGMQETARMGYATTRRKGAAERLASCARGFILFN